MRDSNVTSNNTTDEMDSLHRSSTNIDFEKLIEDQKEEEMPENVIWIAIEQKHLTKIARCWTIFCMLVQILGMFISIGVFCFIPMINFSDTQLPKLTAIFFID